jgi:two-component system, NtrC family, sensor histidine kinase KinB
MSTPSLRTRIRNGTLLMLVLAILFGVYALPRVFMLGRAIRETLYRNYVTIDACQHMSAALRRLELAERDGKARAALPAASKEFMHYMNIENHDFTEVGEPELAGDIERHARDLFGEIAGAPAGARHSRQFDELHARLDDLVAMNRAAMFRADSRASRLGKHLAYELAAAIGILLVAGAAISLGLGWTLSRPLSELIERLRGISQRKSHVRLGPQKLAELEAVAREFNDMAERLEQYEKLNVERLLYEKSKTEAIVEGLEDGVVLIDAAGIVTHINEVATLILGIEAREALGSQFDDLSSASPHYLRVRDALGTFARPGREAMRTEVELHFRGRDHSYVLKPVALRDALGNALGTLLILQDVTYLRDQDRARSNLVATLSHELRTPLTSLALAAELLRREEASLTAQQREVVHAILEECGRMKQLTDNLLTLARGELASIALERETLDLARIADEVADRFAIQAREREIAIAKRIERVPAIRGDSIKLSWVVSNLLGNAIRYTPRGGTIEMVARRADGVVRLEVVDSGPGIAPAVKDHIFERFAQYGGNGAERGSAGLGLAIVKDIVQAHGGRIFVESDPGHGSRFIVELPAAGEG